MNARSFHSVRQGQIARQDELAGAHVQHAPCASHFGARTGQPEPQIAAAPDVKIIKSRQ